MIVVATDDFEVYHGVVTEPRDRGVTFTTIEPDEDLPVPDGTPLVRANPDDSRRAVDEALAVLRGGAVER